MERRTPDAARESVSARALAVLYINQSIIVIDVHMHVCLHAWMRVYVYVHARICALYVCTYTLEVKRNPTRHTDNPRHRASSGVGVFTPDRTISKRRARKSNARDKFVWRTGSERRAPSGHFSHRTLGTPHTNQWERLTVI